MAEDADDNGSGQVPGASSPVPDYLRNSRNNASSAPTSTETAGSDPRQPPAYLLRSNNTEEQNQSYAPHSTEAAASGVIRNLASKVSANLDTRAIKKVNKAELLQQKEVAASAKATAAQEVATEKPGFWNDRAATSSAKAEVKAAERADNAVVSANKATAFAEKFTGVEGVLRKAGWVGRAIFAAYDITQGYKQNGVKGAVLAAVDTGVVLAGAEIGGSIGAAVGSFAIPIPVVGTVAGAVAGGIAGGAAAEKYALPLVHKVEAALGIDLPPAPPDDAPAPGTGNPATSVVPEPNPSSAQPAPVPQNAPDSQAAVTASAQPVDSAKAGTPSVTTKPATETQNAQDSQMANTTTPVTPPVAEEPSIMERVENFFTAGTGVETGTAPVVPATKATEGSLLSRLNPVGENGPKAGPETGTGPVPKTDTGTPSVAEKPDSPTPVINVTDNPDLVNLGQLSTALGASPTEASVSYGKVDRSSRAATANHHTQTTPQARPDYSLSSRDNFGGKGEDMTARLQTQLQKAKDKDGKLYADYADVKNQTSPSGRTVALMQHYLNDHGDHNLAIDGHMGSQTRTATQEFMRDNAGYKGPVDGKSFDTDMQASIAGALDKNPQLFAKPESTPAHEKWTPDRVRQTYGMHDMKSAHAQTASNPPVDVAAPDVFTPSASWGGSRTTVRPANGKGPAVDVTNAEKLGKMLGGENPVHYEMEMRNGVQVQCAVFTPQNGSPEKLKALQSTLGAAGLDTSGIKTDPHQQALSIPVHAVTGDVIHKLDNAAGLKEINKALNTHPPSSVTSLKTQQSSTDAQQPSVVAQNTTKQKKPAAPIPATPYLDA